MMPESQSITRAQIYVGHTVHELTIPSAEELFNSLAQPKLFSISTQPDENGVITRVFINPASFHSALVREVTPPADVVGARRFQVVSDNDKF